MDLSTILYRVWIAYSAGWGLWVSAGMYVWFCICLMVIARKGNTNLWWAGWIPIVNLHVVCAAAKASRICFWQLLIAAVALFAGIVLWMPLWILVWMVLGGIVWVVTWGRICHDRGYAPALGVLVLVPVLNLVLFGLLAFGD